MTTPRTAYIERFTNAFGQTRYRYFGLRKDGVSKNRALAVWSSRDGARKAALRFGYDRVDRKTYLDERTANAR